MGDDGLRTRIGTTAALGSVTMISLRTPRSLFANVCVATAMLVGCSGSDDASGRTNDSTDDGAERMKALESAPGPVVETAPANADIPEVASWEVHQAESGFTTIGYDGNHLAKLAVLVVGTVSSDGTTYELRGASIMQAPGLSRTPAAVMKAIAAALPAGEETTASSLSGAGLRPLDDLYEPAPSLLTKGGCMLKNVFDFLTAQNDGLQAFGACMWDHNSFPDGDCKWAWQDFARYPDVHDCSGRY